MTSINGLYVIVATIVTVNVAPDAWNYGGLDKYTICTWVALAAMWRFVYLCQMTPARNKSRNKNK